MDNIRLPKSATLKIDPKKMYSREGRVNLKSSNRSFALPVTLDPEAMQIVLQDAILAQHRKGLQQEQEDFMNQMEQLRLPPPPPDAMMVE